jgi:hypothetical protein
MRLTHGYHVPRAYYDRDALILWIGRNYARGDECIAHGAMLATFHRDTKRTHPIDSRLIRRSL